MAVDDEEALALLRTLPLLQQTGEETLSKIASVLTTLKYSPGAHIIRENHHGEGLYVLWQGKAKVVSSSSESLTPRHLSVNSTLQRGDYFGLAVPGAVNVLHKVNVIALDEVVCLVLRYEHFDLLSSTSVWNWSEGPANIERMLEFVRVEADIFWSKPQPPRIHKTPNIFGGRLIAQALLAASKTVNADFVVHSLHSYFIRTGKETDLVVYQVQRTRDGTAFATRHIQAIQNGKVIYVQYASFKKPEQSSLEHNDSPMPNVPSPDELCCDEILLDNYLLDPRLPRYVKQKYAGFKHIVGSIDLRQCDPEDGFQIKTKDSRIGLWMRARTELPDDPHLHSCVASFASDLRLLNSLYRTHPESAEMQMQALSLDHSMWFHRSIKADEWFFLEVVGPWTGDGRGLTFGRIYQDGVLVMSISQELLFRKIGEKPLQLAKL